MEESEVAKIVEKTIKSSEDMKIPKCLRNPTTAYAVVMLLFLAALTGWMAFGLAYIENDVKNDDSLTESLIEKLDCQSLKEILKENDLKYYQHRNLVENHLLAECL